jgi:hypothetical protein
MAATTEEQGRAASPSRQESDLLAGLAADLLAGLAADLLAGLAAPWAARLAVI